MKKGDVVEIFEDPISCQKREGAAKLVKLENDNNPAQQFWKVRFLSDGFITTRWIKRTDFLVKHDITKGDSAIKEKTLRAQAIKELANLAWEGMDYGRAEDLVFLEQDTYVLLFKGLSEEECFEFAASLSCEAARYNERRLHHEKR